MVFHTASGEAFTPAQEAQISELVEAMQDLPDVASSVDPFSTEQMRAAQAGLIEAAEGSAMTPEQSHQLEVGKELLGMAEDYHVVSESGSAAIVNISFDKSLMDLPDESKDALMDYLADNAVDGVESDVSNEIAQGVPEIFGISEVIGVLGAGVVLIVVLGSWLWPHYLRSGGAAR